MPGFASTSTFARTTSPTRRSTSASRIGASAWHGPHQAAQKSTITGVSRDRSITSCSKVCSVTSMWVSTAGGRLVILSRRRAGRGGDAPGEAGPLDDPDDAVDVLVGERRLLGEPRSPMGSGRRCPAPRAGGGARGPGPAFARPSGRACGRRRGRWCRTSAPSRAGSPARTKLEVPMQPGMKTGWPTARYRPGSRRSRPGRRGSPPSGARTRARRRGARAWRRCGRRRRPGACVRAVLAEHRGDRAAHAVGDRLPVRPGEVGGGRHRGEVARPSGDDAGAQASWRSGSSIP